MTTQPEDLLNTEEAGGWDAMAAEIDQDLAESQRELKEIETMIGQSQSEVDKLAQRNATITMHLQQVQDQVDTLPASDIQNAYEAALDASQRLVLMRGQLEKLQSDQTHMDRYVKMLQRAKGVVAGADASGETNADSGAGASAGTFATGEMLIQAQESERQKLSRRMHDGPAQTLSNFILQTEIAMRLFDVDQEKAREELGNLKAAASTAFQQIRDFIFDLRPMMLDDLGLVPTVKRYIEHFREKSSMDVTVQVTGSQRRLESYLEVMIFRSMQELLNNTALHSQASQVRVQLDMGTDSIRVSVEDDGRGFDIEQPDSEEIGLGIKLIRERTELIGGQFEIDSAIGKGARIVLSMPAVDVQT